MRGIFQPAPMQIHTNQELENTLDLPTQVSACCPGLGNYFLVDSQLPSIAGYEIVREIGRGGMGVVYLAKQLSLNRLVALKSIVPRSGAEFSELLISEAQIVGKLNHAAIVPIYEASMTGAIWYFSMGLVAGEDLAHRLARGVLSVRQVTSIATTICDALEHAHQNGVLHLDIKPGNILLDVTDAPKLTDFGLAAIHANRIRTNDNSKQSTFTPQFMSPEQALGATEVSAASDIYSLGAVMYAALVGRPPIVSANYEDLVLRVISQSPSSLRQFGLRIPRPLDAIILKCLQKNPSQRYASALDLKNDLLAFASGQPVSARPTSLLANLEYQLRRHVLAASVSGSAVLLLLVLASMIVLRSWSQSTQIIALQTDNDRLHRLVALQYQLMRGRTNQDSIAIQLAASGDLDRAAFYAAEAIESGQVMDDKVIADLLAIVANYSERHPSSSRDVESQEQLIARVVTESESVHTAILRATAAEQTGITSREREPSREIGAQK